MAERLTGYYRIREQGVEICAWCCPDSTEEALIETYGADCITHIVCRPCLHKELPGSTRILGSLDFGPRGAATLIGAVGLLSWAAWRIFS